MQIQKKMFLSVLSGKFLIKENRQKIKSASLWRMVSQSVALPPSAGLALV